MKILAVDDDPSIRELLTIILAQAGVTNVTVASSADHALREIAAQAEPFECFLLDIQMPGKSGIDLCGHIRRLPIYRKAPIIMLTAMKEKSHIDQAFEAGATDYATKPFDRSEIHARVRMARLLAEEQRRVREMSTKVRPPAKTADPDPRPNFEEPLELGGVKSLVTAQAFENYLRQLSRAGSMSSSFFAVHIQNGLKLFDRSTSSDFEYALCHVADAIVAASNSDTVIMCYVGGGNFICSANTTTMKLVNEFENDIQELLDDKNLTHDDGSPMDIEIANGATIQPLLTEPLLLEPLKAQAVRRALVRASEKNAESKLVNIKHV